MIKVGRAGIGDLTDVYEVRDIGRRGSLGRVVAAARQSFFLSAEF